MRSSTVGLIIIAVAGAIILTLSILELVSTWLSFLALLILSTSLLVTLFSK